MTAVTAFILPCLPLTVRGQITGREILAEPCYWLIPYA
jgi:hypothetical protein